MKPERYFSLILGAGLILIGALSLAGNTLLQMEAWRMWPITVVLLGIGLTVPGFWGLSRHGLGSFFIPGIPVLITGGILLSASLLNRWNIWAIAWPLEFIGLGIGFGLAAIFMRVPALAIPAIIIGANGLLLGFCSLTGLWQSWVLLWPIEPLSVGLGLMVLSFYNHSRGVRTAAFVLFLVAGGGFFLSSLISIFNTTVLRFGAPLLLIITGALVALLSFTKQPETGQQETANESKQADSGPDPVTDQAAA